MTAPVEKCFEDFDSVPTYSIISSKRQATIHIANS